MASHRADGSIDYKQLRRGSLGRGCRAAESSTELIDVRGSTRMAKSKTPQAGDCGTVETEMDISDLSHDAASNAELIGWSGASPQVIARVLNAALAALGPVRLRRIAVRHCARPRPEGGAAARHQSIYDMPYASSPPRQKHLLADAFDLFLRLGLEFRARGDGSDDLDGAEDDDLPALRDMDDDDDVIDIDER